MTFLAMPQWEKQVLQIIYETHGVPLLAKELSDLVLFSKFHVPTEAWRLKLHRHFLTEHFCILNSSLQMVNGSPAPTPDRHTKLKGETRDWQLSSLETPRDVFSVYSFTVVT